MSDEMRKLLREIEEEARSLTILLGAVTTHLDIAVKSLEVAEERLDNANEAADKLLKEVRK